MKKILLEELNFRSKFGYSSLKTSGKVRLLAYVVKLYGASLNQLSFLHPSALKEDEVQNGFTFFVHPAMVDGQDMVSCIKLCSLLSSCISSPQALLYVKTCEDLWFLD